ncbi:alpha/beta hydrolase [Fructilactobacillus florum]|uniref:alpha/beta hydrolase n=1 Tax=Fructilactobacillus florum TaxID=640331 RepID=UPI000B137D9E|nr:alpha/beta hydrolase [Fructilactobacillus florum]
MNKIFNKRDIVVLIIGILAVLGGFFYIQFGVGGSKEMQNARQPIIFVSDKNRVSGAAQHLVTTTSRSGGAVAIHINVLDNGKIEYDGNQNVKAKQPIIEVNFNDRSKTTQQQAQSLNQILRKLNHRYAYKQYDAIGFGSGSLAVYYNAVKYRTSGNRMMLNHFVSIAGPYQGVLPLQPPHGEHRTTNQRATQPPQPVRPDWATITNQRFPSYQEMQHLSKRLDPNTEVLNIYGVISDRDRSDGRVSEASASSLKKLIKNKDNYQSLRLTGPYAEHASLLDNQVAERIINRFLFNQ